MTLGHLSIEQLLERDKDLEAAIAIEREAAQVHLDKIMPFLNARLTINAELERRKQPPGA